jgi:hypothetical protein
MLAREVLLFMGTLCAIRGQKWNYERGWPVSVSEQCDPEDGSSMFHQITSICIQTASWCLTLEDCNINSDYLENINITSVESHSFCQSIIIGF